MLETPELYPLRATSPRYISTISAAMKYFKTGEILEQIIPQTIYLS